MTIAEAIKEAWAKRDGQMAGEIADVCRAHPKLRYNYKQTQEFFQRGCPDCGPPEFEELMQEADYWESM